MQMDPLAGLDLTSDPAHANPSPGANPACFSQSCPRAPESIDLTDQEVPTEAATVQAHRIQIREHSTVTVECGLWPPRLKFKYEVEGPLSWAAPLSAVVLLSSIGAAVFIPHLALPTDAPPVLHFVASAASGLVYLVAGTLLLCLLRMRP